jgi:RNA polymerase sigma-70 factor (sigma-E family)
VDVILERSPVQDGIEEFIASRYGSLVRQATLLVGDERLAEDIVQETLAKFWLASGRGGVLNADAYVRRVMVNSAVSGWRRRRPHDVVASPRNDGPSGEDPTVRFDDRDQMWRALLQLPPRQRAVLVLRYYCDLSEADICDALDITPGTVRSQTTKAKTRLRAVFGTRDGAPQ